MPSNSSTNMLSLWVFADASAKALATCAYLRHEETRKVSTLISGKTRLTPKKTKQTIPKLEVVAILMATRLAKNIASAIRIQLNEINLLSDSEIALSWIKSSRTLPLFVENQKQHILKIKDGLESVGINVNFFHVRTADNSADARTKGADASLIVDLPWVRGPQWLNNEKIPTRLRKLADIHEQKEVEEDSETLGDYATTVQLAGVSTSSNPGLITCTILTLR
uniref:RNase H domain-containing protein n=1 Tax=Haemonchus contortus TaxID=6289 RepID=A0A7I4Z638_HAECO